MQDESRARNATVGRRAALWHDGVEFVQCAGDAWCAVLLFCGSALRRRIVRGEEPA